jgi:hypothetical protein
MIVSNGAVFSLCFFAEAEELVTSLPFRHYAFWSDTAAFAPPRLASNMLRFTK